LQVGITDDCTNNAFFLTLDVVDNQYAIDDSSLTIFPIISSTYGDVSYFNNFQSIIIDSLESECATNTDGFNVFNSHLNLCGNIETAELLNVKTLLPKNSTQLELDLEQSMALGFNLPVEEIPKIWNPDLCPTDLLPWLAWAFSVDVWDSQWLESKKRRIIKESYWLHRKKGTRFAITELLSALEINDFEIIEWWQQTPKGHPHTFYLRINSSSTDNVQFGYELYQRLKNIIDTVKPERSRYFYEVYNKLTSSGNKNKFTIGGKPQLIESVFVKSVVRSGVNNTNTTILWLGQYIIQNADVKVVI
jgi:phage tail P2-like protein